MFEKNSKESSENILQTIWYKFFPYWPLFVLLPGLFLILGVAFTFYKKPSYTVAASLVITNEENNNRSYSSQPFQALNPFATTQVVDNEVLILQSRSLMKDVVNSLRLYAQVWEKRSVSAYSAWIGSPVLIEAQEPEKLQPKSAIYFDYDGNSQTVKIEKKHYTLDQWYRFPFGTIRFVRNPNFKQRSHRALYFSLEHPTIVAEQLTGHLKVASVSKLSTTVNISYQTDVPELGESIVNELLRQYLQSSIEHENALASNTLVFVDERLRDVERELDSIERGIQAFRTRTGAIDLGEQSRIYLQNVAETDRRISEIDAQLAILGQVANYVNGDRLRTGVIPTNLGIEDPVLAELINQLNELELQLANQRTTTGANNPVVRSIENEIQKIRPNIQNIVGNQQSRLRASRNNLASTSGRISSTIRNIPGQERELLEISRQQAVKRDLYAFLLQRREEAALSNSSSIANNRIVDWADANVAKANSGKMIILVGCLLLGLVLAVAYIIARESFTRSVLFRSEVETQVAFPIVSEIFYLRRPKKSRSIVLYETLLAKEFNQLQAALGLFHHSNTRKTIMVTSSLLGEGTSYIGKHLAVQLATAGRRTLLIDLNLLKPDATRTFHLQDQLGFADLFDNEQPLDRILYKSDFSNLFVLPAGAKSANALSLLTDSRMSEVINQLRAQFDFIVIDAPPVQLSSEAFAAARFADTTILVVRHGITPKRILKKLDDNVEVKTLKEVNVVLNGIKPRGFPSRYYGYGYGFGHELMPRKQLLKLSKTAK